MTTAAFRPTNAIPSLPTMPNGWPIGSYDTYEGAQRAVEHLASTDFPVTEVTIVGVDLMLVERIVGRLTWGKVLGTGALSGAWFGLFVGVLLMWFSSQGNSVVTVAVGVVAGILFGLTFAAVSYLSTRGRRDFASASQLVAGRYDVLCQPRNAERGRDLLAKLSMRPSGGTP